MSFSSRIYGMIEMEISRQLSFTLAIDTSHSVAIDPHRIRIGDTVRFSVTARNDADFKIRSIRGGIAPTKSVRFRPVNFVVAELPPGSKAVVATVDAMVTALPQTGSVMDDAATISLSAGADLAHLVFQEWEKPVVFTTRHGQRPSQDRVRVTLGNSRTRTKGAIPLSGIPLSDLV